jgi:RHS repeat-associated protein
VQRLRTVLVVSCVLALVLGVAGSNVVPTPVPARQQPTPPVAAAAPQGPGLWQRLLGSLGIGDKQPGGKPTVAAQGGPAAPLGPPAKPAAAKPAGPARRVGELVDKRTANSRLFELSDGRVQAELSTGAVNYRDPAGRWQPIDTRLRPLGGRPGFVYGATRNSFGSLFGRSSQRLLRFEQAGRQLTVGLPGPAVTLTPTVRGSTVTYPGVLGAGADLVWRVTPEGVKEQIVLAGRPADPTWRFTLQLDGVLARAQADGSIGLFPTGGGEVPVWVLPKPFMTDAADDPASPHGKRWSDKVTQTLVQHANTVEVTVRADPAWLAAPERRWPVVVDPTIKIQPVSWEQSLDVGIRSDLPTTNLDSLWQLAVGSTTAIKARSLVQFPLSDIPPGTQIASAQLQAWFDGSWGVAPDTAVAIEARRVTASWADTTATWNSMNTRFAEAGLSTASRGVNQSAAWHSLDVKNIVQTWLNGAQPNYGFMLKATNETLNQGGPIYEAAPGIAGVYPYDYGGETQNGPTLLVTYGRPSVSLNFPTTITATGAQLSWTPYVDPSPSPDDDLIEYQVHRRPNGTSSTTPTCGPLSWSWCRYESRVAVLPAGTTSYLDTSAPPTPADDPSPLGKAYDYWIVVKTRDGQASASGVQVAWLPKAGRTRVVVQGSSVLDTTLSSTQQTTGHDVLDGRPWLGVGNNSSTYGITRTLAKFPIPASVPTTATVLDAELSLWHPMTFGAGTATYNMHALTKAFNETAATWNNASATVAWTNKGGDFNATVLASLSGFSTTAEPKWRNWKATNLKNTVQGWVANPATNLGVLVKLANETTPAERSLMLSSEVGEPLLRPRLTVTYTERTPANTYHAPSTPQELTAGDTTTVPVTITNTTTSILRAADYRLGYKWLQPDGSLDPASAASQVLTPLPADLAPGAAVTVNATLKALTPAAPTGARMAYVPTWDLFNQTTGTYLSAAAGGVAGLGQNVAVAEPTSDELGLEKFYQYAGANTGSGTAALVNQHSGNLVWSYDPISNPSRGPHTFLRLTYNSQDTSNSAAGFGFSVSAASVMRLGTPLQFHPPGQSWPTTIKLTDGDGTTHTFTLNKHGSTNEAAWDYDHPFGVHLYLQKNSTTDTARTWVMTRPDRTKFYFDADGYQSATVDNNGHELLFTWERRKSNNKPIKFLKYLTDAATRQTLTLTYYAKGQTYDYYDTTTNQRLSGTNLTKPEIIDQIQTITDISGRQLKLIYSDKGLLKELVDGAGTSLAKTFLFDYDMTQGNKNVKLVKVTDPRVHATNLAYYSPPNDDPKFHWWAKTITDRRNNPTGFAYVDPDGPQGSVIESTVTDPEQHATFYRTDGFGRPEFTRDAKQQETALTWDGDHNVIQLQEDNGALSKWTYDPKTGFPLTITDAQAVADGTASTTLTYQTSSNGFVAELTEKRSPEGRRWVFGYDAKGNLTSVTDPKGTATPTDPNDFVTRYEYDALGQLSKITDANEHATLYSSFDPTGYPKTITDARTKATGFTYDVRGNVLTVTDPLGKTTSQAYDLFGRPGELRVPKNQAGGEFVITPAPVYDRNDNVTTSTAPNGAITTAVYDPADQLASTSLPKDFPTDPARTSSFTYDKVGNLRTQTEPKGTLTASIPNDFATTYTYDEIYQLTAVTNVNNDRLSYIYDNVGNVTTVVDPRKNATSDPADYTTNYAYDRSHRVLRTTDAAGNFTATDYDLDGLTVSTTDQEGNTTLIDLDERGKPREVRVPHDNPGGTISYHTTRYEYDEVGNRTRVISPRGVATTNDPDDFAITTVYDEVNRVSEQQLPFDRDDSQITTADRIVYTYDDAGRLQTLSAPPSAGQTARNITTYSHFDNGWVKSATDPWDIRTTYEYNPLGEQISRTVTSSGGSSSRAMGWTYFPDGKLATRTDDGIPVGQHVVLVDNSDTGNVAVTGTWPTATSGSGFQGLDYRTHAAGAGTATFTWKLQVPQSGTYAVFARYPSGATATNAPYKVEHAAGATTTPVNQTQNAGTWVSLGSFSFTEGDGGAGRQVVLSDAANGSVVADAVKLVRDNSADPDGEGKSLTYRYDPNGNLVATTDASSNARVDAYTIVYDELNRVDKVEERNGGVTGTIRNTTRFTYDPNSNPATRSHDDEFASYVYDLRDLVQTASNGKTATDPDPKVTRFTYTPRGQKLRETKANNNTVDYTYFLDGLLKTQVEKKASDTLVSSHTIAYDPNGQRISDAAKKQNADNHAAYLDNIYAYTYDPRDRIRQVTKSAAGGGVLETESYTHDANSNVITQTVDNATTNFTYDRNRLLTATTTGSAPASYNYDPFGRLDKVIAGTTVLERYLYDGFDRVTEHRKATGTGGTQTTRYAYDPLDRTASRTKNAGAPGEERTDFNYLGLSGEVLSEEVAGQVKVAYQYSPWGQRLSQVKFTPGGGEEDSFYGYNPHSDVETLTNESGDARATYGYTAYGKDDKEAFTGIDKPDPQNPTAEPYNVYRFNAKRFDPATGDYDMGFRDYDPGLNRFLTRDMYNGALADLDLGLSPWTMNRYGFAGGNPVSFIEADGHRPADCDAACMRAWSRAQNERASEEAMIWELLHVDDEGGDPQSGSTSTKQPDPQTFIVCGSGELGEAINDAAKTLTDNDNFLDPQASCITQTQQRAVMPVQIGGMMVGVQVIMPGYNFSSGSGGGPGGSAKGPAAKAGKDIVSETAQSVADKGWKYLYSKMSPKMRALLKRKPFLNRRAAGLVVHDETNRILEAKYGKRFKYQRSGEVDFIDNTSGGQEIELSTTAGVARHWSYQRFWHPNVQYATYDLPSDIP